ncbi:MAG: hypothetical protein D6751_07320 [Deltaproteobacteria bacterium]|nr:MAG: hypothetical protein D6751_07320 [Deltaproteobacteria bacterium]
MNDFLLDGGDLQIANGDFVIGQSDLQNVELVVRLSPGNLKHEPLAGFGEERLINGNFDAAQRRALQLALEADGYRLRTMRYNDRNLLLEI